MFIIVLAVLLQLFNPSLVLAQDQNETNFNAAYDQYRSAQNSYTLKRGAYLSSQTLAAQDEARAATYELLRTRDVSVIAYLLMLQSRFNEATGVEDARPVFSPLLDQEISWFRSHEQSLSTGASLDDMVADSNEARDRYEDVTLPLVYKVLSQIAIGKESFLRLKQLSIVNELTNKVGVIRNEGIINNALIERSITDTQNLITRSEGKGNEANTIIADFDGRNPKHSQIYDRVVTRITEGVQYLKDANAFLTEIMFRITHG